MAEYKLIRKTAGKVRKRTNKKRLINQDIFKVSVFFALIFGALIVFLCIFLAVQAGSVINSPYNKRADALKKTVVRGSILSADGTVLAESLLDENGNETRNYPYGEAFFHVVGFDCRGAMGIESAYNYYLLSSNANVFSKIASEFSSLKLFGDSIITTLNVGLQLKLNDILGDNEGAIVVIDPSTGAVLGICSKPGFNPNEINAAWDDITSDSNNSVLLNRATQATLAPGSTFKLFTLLEYYREKDGKVDDFEYVCEGFVNEDGHTFGCPLFTAHGWQDIKSAFANSCNCAFSEIGLNLDIDKFAENNNKLLFNTDLGIDLPTKDSSFTLESNDSNFLKMQTAFGQGETLVSPMHLAMVTCAIANNGVLMQPHLVTNVIDSEGNNVKTFKNQVKGQLLTEDEAAFMKEEMRAVVTQGTAIVLSYDGNYISYGKTGTAETSSNKEENHDHSWFTGFAENDGRTIVVCAMIENTQQAGITGVSAAKQVFDYYFN